MSCHCGRDRRFDACCGAIHRGAAAATAEDLMRSRYAAHVVRDEAYLRHSWATATCPEVIALDPAIRWTRLDIVDVADGGALAAEGVVEFAAHFDHPGGPGVQTERSVFRREGGRWVYVGPEA